MRCAVGHPDHQPLMHQMLDTVHHEQRIALRAFMDEGGKGGSDRPPQAPGDRRLHVCRRQEFQAQFHRPSPPTQLLHHAPQRMPVQHHLHRAIRSHHQ